MNKLSQFIFHSAAPMPLAFLHLPLCLRPPQSHWGESLPGLRSKKTNRLVNANADTHDMTKLRTHLPARDSLHPTKKEAQTLIMSDSCMALSPQTGDPSPAPRRMGDKVSNALLSAHTASRALHHHLYSYAPARAFDIFDPIR